MPDIFSYGTPESVGLRSADMEAMFRELEKRRFGSHGLLVARGGRIVAEGYFSPFDKDTFHRMYSTSKSFAATAIGCLMDEGRIRPDDKILKFFPEKERPDMHPWVRNMTVDDLLTMRTCFSGGNTYSSHRDDWVDSFFTTAPDHPSGTYFNYDTSGSFILDVIVERLTGQKYLDYLKDKCLRDCGFSEDAWCVESPDGYSWGGSGVQCTLRDLARLGQLYLNGGRAGGKQLLSEAFVRAATQEQVDNNTEGHLDLLNGQGYGYQIWCLPDGCFAFRGMGGQVCLCSPDTGFLLAAISDEQGGACGYQLLADLFFRYLVWPAAEGRIPARLPEDEAACRHLREHTAHLSLTLSILGETASPRAADFVGKTYHMDENSMGIERFRLDMEGTTGTFRFFARGEEKTIPFGLGTYVAHRFPETSYSGRRIRTPKGEGYKSLSAALWTEPRKLVLRTLVVDDYFGNLTVTFAFRDREVSLFMQKTAEWFLDEYQGLGVGHTDE